jgi:hypothetical protein
LGARTNYATDLPVCLGLTSASGGEVSAAVARLGGELLAFIRERTPNVDDQPELTRYLADGTLERHLGLIEWRGDVLPRRYSASDLVTLRSRPTLERQFWLGAARRTPIGTLGEPRRSTYS